MSKKKKSTVTKKEKSPRASMDCPICGIGEPHAHGDTDVLCWLNAQASRFGLQVVDKRIIFRHKISGLASLIISGLSRHGYIRGITQDMEDAEKIVFKSLMNSGAQIEQRKAKREGIDGD